MPTLSAHHVAITVEDLERTVAFYRDVLGFAVEDRFTVDGDGFATAVEIPDAVGSFAHLDAGGVILELVEYDPMGETRSTPSLNEPGANHLGFEVDDLAETYADFDADVETLSEPQTTPTGVAICFVRDPEGNLVELLEPGAE